MSEDGRMTIHTVTVTLDEPGRYSVECACGRLATYAHDDDLGTTIKVHLEADTTDVIADKAYQRGLAEYRNETSDSADLRPRKENPDA